VAIERTTSKIMNIGTDHQEQPIAQSGKVSSGNVKPQTGKAHTQLAACVPIIRWWRFIIILVRQPQGCEMLLAVDRCKSALLSASIKGQSSSFSMLRIDNGGDNG